MRKEYYKFMPRGFSNEFTLFSVDSPARRAALFEYAKDARIGGRGENVYLTGAILERVPFKDLRHYSSDPRPF